jgi:hypothetical protein
MIKIKSYLKTLTPSVRKPAVMYCLGLIRRLFARKKEFPLSVDEIEPCDSFSIEGELQKLYDLTCSKKTIL